MIPARWRYSRHWPTKLDDAIGSVFFEAFFSLLGGSRVSARLPLSRTRLRI